jgi:EmrB/QacA subfamily drug resistance transporter
VSESAPPDPHTVEPASDHPMGMSSDDPRRWWALAVIAVAQLMIILDASIVNIALPSAQAELGISTADRQWVITAYTLTFGGLLLLGGRIADYTGRKRTFILGLLGFAVASGLGGIAPNAGLLFAARGLQGAFAALMAPAALSLITVTFVDPKERAKAFGVFGAVSGGGAAIGLIVGGVLTEYASWRWCLGVNVPIALLAALAAVYAVHESKAPGDTSYDIPGAVLSALGLVSLVYGFTEAAKAKNPADPTDTSVQGWTHNTTVLFLALAVVLLVAFFLWERRAKNPLLPLRIILDRNRGGAYLTFLFVGAGLFAMFLFLTYYFQINLGYSPLKAGFAFLPFSAGIILAAGLVANLLPKIGPRPLMIPGLVMAILGMLLLTRIGEDASYVSHVLPAQLLMSVGLAGVFIPSASVALLGAGHHDAGVASAVLNSSQQIGGSLGTALLNTVYASAVTAFITANVTNPAELPQQLPLAFLHGYRVAFVWGAALFALALLATVVLIRAKKEDVPQDAGMVAA